MQRRRFLISAGALAAGPLAAQVARAQGRARLPVLGELSPLPRPTPEVHGKRAWVAKLRELSWVEGTNYRYLSAHTDEGESRLGERAEFLVSAGVDLIYALGPEAAVAAARATRTIPIVFWGVAYPVEQGLADSIARPGRNATGTAWYAGPGVDAKRLEVLKELVPHAKRLARISVPTANATVSGEKFVLPETFNAAIAALGYESREFPISSAADLEPTFAAILAWNTQVLTVAGTTLTVRERARIVAFTTRHRIPCSFVSRWFVEAGGLVSYGMTLDPTGYRLAEFMDKILRGAKPGDLPIDVPRDYETTVNLKTAKALGIAVPQSLLLRADKVFE